MFQCKECYHMFEEPVSVVTVEEENVPREELQCPKCGETALAVLDEEWGWDV